MKTLYADIVPCPAGFNGDWLEVNFQNFHLDKGLELDCSFFAHRNFEGHKKIWLRFKDLDSSATNQEQFEVFFMDIVLDRLFVSRKVLPAPETGVK